MLSSREIRQQFMDFFVKQHDHTFVPSSSVVPHDDPTLLFSNAGMNQFKDVFLGTGQRPYKRAANTQKCIRAGGKHNDLDDVGKDTYHHTFFEMLGNWSFGDYFKTEAITWAWQLLTDVWKLDRSRLHVTVFGGDPSERLDRDDEAADIWHRIAGVPKDHIHLGSKKDNFWEMGETGPCGPCTEIHIDLTPDRSGAKLVNAGTADVIEIWNLVFIQFNRGADKQLTPLPAKHVDTGMGFERVTAVLQNQRSNYDTDIFAPIFTAIQRLTQTAAYGGQLKDMKDVAYRVIADHIRALTFALTDGAVPSNEKRGYVLRSILRRAERYGRQYLNTKEPFLHHLVPTVVECMGQAFPELNRQPAQVADMIRDEEKAFLATLDRGIKLFADVVQRTQGGVISGKDVFDLHTTYGFFPDITEQMASEVGLTIDRSDYERRMDEFRGQSGEKRQKFVITAVSGELPRTDDALKYQTLGTHATLLGWVRHNSVEREGTLHLGDEAALLVSTTNFYAEQGGQVGDTGTIRTPTGVFRVEDTQRLGDAVLHLGRVEDGSLTVNQTASLNVDERRIDTMRNHTATHLMNFALRRVLGGDIEQKGSLVDADKTRFDFTHQSALTFEQLAEVEQIVNDIVQHNLPVTTQTLPLAQARQIPGVRAVFGEKYPDPVRVVMIGPANAQTATVDHSVEFCGGTHLRSSGGIGLFKIVSQEAVGKGVRRVTAVTGPRAVATVQDMTRLLDTLAGQLHCKADELPARVEALQDELKKLQTQLKKGTAGDLKNLMDQLLTTAQELHGVKVVIGEIPPAATEVIRAQVDRLWQRSDPIVVVLGWNEDGKANILTAVPKQLTARGLHAGDLVKQATAIVEGKGGGKADGIAQGAGKNTAKLGEALTFARSQIVAKLGG